MNRLEKLVKEKAAKREAKRVLRQSYDNHRQSILQEIDGQVCSLLEECNKLYAKGLMTGADETFKFSAKIDGRSTEFLLDGERNPPVISERSYIVKLLRIKFDAQGQRTTEAQDGPGPYRSLTIRAGKMDGIVVYKTLEYLNVLRWLLGEWPTS